MQVITTEAVIVRLVGDRSGPCVCPLKSRAADGLWRGPRERYVVPVKEAWNAAPLRCGLNEGRKHPCPSSSGHGSKGASKRRAASSAKATGDEVHRVGLSPHPGSACLP